MNPALETLFLPWTRGLELPAGAAVFLNARYHPFLEKMRSGGLHLQQHFKPCAQELEQRGFKTSPDFTDMQVSMVFAMLPKNAIEARYFVACGLRTLKPQGIIAIAAANDAGGARLKKILQHFGLEDVHEHSKNKARMAWAQRTDIKQDVLDAALKEGSAQPVQDGAFQSMPGLFSWDRGDRGSRMLAKYLPAELKGSGADFGCGYGWLARHVLQHCAGIESLACVDADTRAVELCRINLKQHAHVSCAWMDLTQQSPGQFDWIVMNPPFHEGRDADAGIGRDFIATAARSLKKGGRLWMVANAKLSYEDMLEKSFSSCARQCEEEGFKVFGAVK
jgi:16S rRNA (guanine1207-N2)-methyltransferase